MVDVRINETFIIKMRSLYIANTQFLTKKAVCNLSRRSFHPILFRLRIERGGVTSRNDGSKILSNNDDNGNENGQANKTFILAKH